MTASQFARRSLGSVKRVGVKRWRYSRAADTASEINVETDRERNLRRFGAIQYSRSGIGKNIRKCTHLSMRMPKM